jgi:hypothetical protein
VLPFLLLLAQNRTLPFDRVELDPLAGITLVYEQDGLMDTDLWGLEFTYPIVEPLPTNEIVRVRTVLHKAFSKYPPGFIKKHLNRILICGDLIVDGYPYGATYGDRSLFIVDGGISQGFDNRFIEQSFHHEFSSVLLLEPGSRFPRDKWNAANPPKFSYQGYDGVYADKKNQVDWEEQRPQWLRMGFVKRYSFTSLEEDLNTVAESMFAGGSRFWRQADQNPRLLQKARTYLLFLNSLQPWFRESRIRTYR